MSNCLRMWGSIKINKQLTVEEVNEVNDLNYIESAGLYIPWRVESLNREALLPIDMVRELRPATALQ